MKTLDVTALPLQGRQLIEASAGTGKTHAIASLFLRLVLERGLTAGEVLVVTFTKAATDELRSRIRQRLATALQHLSLPETIAGIGDRDLRLLLERTHAADDRDARLRHLRVQLSAMDDAAIFTIHGFCQRVLAETAFAGGEPFITELTQDSHALLRQSAADWWRRRLQPDPLLARIAAADADLCTPDALAARLAPLAARDLRIDHDNSDPARQRALGAAVRTAWQQEGEALVAEIRRLTAEGVLSAAEKTLRDDAVTAAADAMRAFCADADASLPAPVALRLGQAFLDDCVLAKAAKAGKRAPAFALSTQLDALAASATALAQSLLAEALAFCRADTEKRKRRDAVLGFDDLVRRLRDALAAPGGDTLARRLVARHPAALVDECQDTDPAQYAIFERIYAQEATACLLLIGDPKQAIYSFRGADVFAYLGARRATPDAARHTLGTNWRSVRPLVEGVNALFARTRTQAFLYPDAIGFAPVAAAGKADAQPLLVDGKPPAPLLFDLAPAPTHKSSGLYAKEEFQQLAATAAAARIADLLAAARAGRAVCGGRALDLRDIAVLVRTHREGAMVQDALRAAGIGSAIASQDDVYAGDEAEALQQVLAAIADPANDRLLRRALVSAIWRLQAPELEQLRQDEAAADLLRNRIADYHALWLQRGFMPMFRAWLHGEGIPARLWQTGNGERAMTNLLQLAELLQAASREHPSPDALRKYLAATRADGPVAEEHQLRLESDENLVQIVTLHRSKGLQYPVVFLPFLACSRRPDSAPPTLWHDADGALVCTLRADATAQATHAREQLAEDLRLAYVALTRAQYQCVVGWGAVNNGEYAALAWLLLGTAGDAADLAAWHARVRAMKHDDRCAPLQQLATDLPQAIACSDMPAQARPLPPVAAPTAHWQARKPARSIRQDWRQTSYSTLADSRAGSAVRGHDVAGEDALPSPVPAADDIAAFPRGRRAGQCFHALMEHLDFPQARDALLRNEATRQLARHGFPARWCDTLAHAVGDVLDTPLDDQGFTLRSISRDRRRDECEFFFPLRQLRAEQLESLLPTGDTADGTAHGTLRFAPVSGVLHGFIDLVFEHAGRWYLADWKTNWLGPDASHYGPAALQAAMREHRYDLQYSLYTVALHRYLAARVPGYDPARHFGGVYYFFVRGMQPAHGTRTGVFFRRATPADIHALDAAMAGREAP